MRMQGDKKPLVSVIMGVRYRRDDLSLLRRSVGSILDQSFKDFEFLICEDGSTDEAKEYLKAMEKEDSRVQVICGRGADTLAAKLNRCLDAAQGKFIARQDDDDISDVSRLETQIEYLKSHCEIAFVGGVARLEQDGKIVGLRKLPEFPQVKDFLFVQPFLHPTIVFHNRVFADGMRYCESTRCAGCEDYDLLLRLYESGAEGANLQEPCFTYTLPPRGTSNRTWEMRWNEVYTRWTRFKSLGLLPNAIPYVIKPVLVGLIPQEILDKIKEQRQCRT